jgi:hypothetical protein
MLNRAQNSSNDGCCCCWQVHDSKGMRSRRMSELHNSVSNFAQSCFEKKKKNSETHEGKYPGMYPQQSLDVLPPMFPAMQMLQPQHS